MNSEQIKGLPVIGVTEGETLGKIDDVYADLEGRRVLGFYVVGANGRPDAYLDPDDVRSIGADAVMVEQAAAVRGDATRAQIGSLESLGAMRGRKVLTEGGTSVGAVANVEFEPPDFAFTALEVSPGFFTANTRLPFAEVVSIGPDLIIVANAVADAADKMTADVTDPAAAMSTAV